MTKKRASGEHPISKEMFLEALREKLGIVSLACKQVGISKQVFDTWCEEDSDFVEAVRQCDEVVLDFTEAKLYEKISKGDAKLICFLLETKGKRRGYGKRKENEEVTGPVILFPEEANMFVDSENSIDNENR